MSAPPAAAPRAALTTEPGSGWPELVPPPFSPEVDLPYQSGDLRDLDPPASRLMVFVAAALIITILSVAGAWVWLLTRGSQPTSTANRGSVVALGGGAEGSPAPEPTTPDRAPSPPVPLPADASYTGLTVLPGGDLAVQQWIRSDDDVSQIRVAAPPGTPAASAVSATDLEVYAGGAPVGRTGHVIAPESFTFAGARSVYLRYTLSGALEHSDSEEGRALARVTSLDLAYAATRGSMTIEFTNAEVLSLACVPTTTAGPPEPCGLERGSTWQVEAPQPDAGYRVMAQLDLDPGASG